MILDKIAYLFPGQGSQNIEMFAGKLDYPAKQLHDIVRKITGEDLRTGIRTSGKEYLQNNLISSLAIVTASAIALEQCTKKGYGKPSFYAGYSVGQWTALYAAGALPFDQLVSVIAHRAELMNSSANGRMISCLGLSNSAIEEFCVLLETENKYCRIANFNCFGNITLSVAGEFKAEILARLAALGPKQLSPREGEGAWHCSLLTNARNSFRKYLNNISFQPVSIPVIDNCTGELLPDDPVRLRDQLADHLILPVRWEDGINTLIANGINTFLEVGHGSMLSNFGFFIDRNSKFISFNS